MSTAMYDAREALIPGSVYDRSSNGEKAKTPDCFCDVRQFTLGEKKRGLIVFFYLLQDVRPICTSRPMTRLG